MKIAIIGSGISGLVAARKLHEAHDITLFEARDYVGGHTHTVPVPTQHGEVGVDMGFIVFNEWTYPNFIALMDQLGVASQTSHMSFSVKCAQSGLEYNGTSFNTLFAQRRNLISPQFWRMLWDINRFNNEGKALLDQDGDETTLGQFLTSGGYGRQFIDKYILPMGAAIWSANRADMLAFPLRFFLKFFNNHGMLSVNQRPVWHVIQGGSNTYVPPLIQPFKDRIRLRTPVAHVQRLNNHVIVQPNSEPAENFDQVVFACHSDQALRLLNNPTRAEQEILGAIPYRKNQVVLHTDTSILPRNRRAWAAWNYHIPPTPKDRVTVTYNMNILQGFQEPSTYCVTLNETEAVNPACIIKEVEFAHPQFSIEAAKAQARHGEISGVNNTFYCGAYWYWGFHEDGVRSGLRVAEQIMNRSGDRIEVPV